MKTKTTFLSCRKETGLLQQDVAYIFHQDTGMYNKHEKGHRRPTLETILGFHILFGKSLETLFPNHMKTMRERIVTRSKKRIEQLKMEQPQRGKHRIAYLTSFVNGLHNKHHG
ncbi:helix-turn-helix domain-containing protein [Flavivirga eckloniae]|uniref:HTH cro/C1-type domain-containing protein n=1 Tax=Flavivirga eckloniae TaxID=1803846 RepID=A0A2K9PPX2_9FLAO|nr:helix-turn-helix transcriptional regulator [Flavivirga eckloniae]AUP79094.1 hypothetical protein C1H87_10430 [Flavivirga eckloniae]